MAKDLEVTVRNSKTGKRDGLKSIKMETDNNLSKGGERYADTKSDARAKEIATSKGGSRVDRDYRVGAKASLIKRRGKKRK